MENFLNYIIKLYHEKRQLVLLSWFYGAVAFVAFMIAGFCALINQAFGVSLLILPIIALTALCANVTVWALLKLVVSHIEEARKATKSNSTSKSKVEESSKEVQKPKHSSKKDSKTETAVKKSS